MKYFIFVIGMFLLCASTLLSLSCDQYFILYTSNKTPEKVLVTVTITPPDNGREIVIGNVAPGERAQKSLGIAGRPASIRVTAKGEDGRTIYDRSFTSEDYSYEGFQVTITTS